MTYARNTRTTSCPTSIWQRSPRQPWNYPRHCRGHDHNATCHTPTPRHYTSTSQATHGQGINGERVDQSNQAWDRGGCDA